MTALYPGTLLRIETGKGPRLVQITHMPRPYPPVLRALKADDAESDTAFIAMADLPLNDPRVHPAGSAPIPASARAFPTFRLAVRDKAGIPIYWWHWDGEGLRLAPSQDDETLPLRKVTRFDALLLALENV